MSADKQDRSITEKVTVSGNQVVDYAKNLIAAGNVRRRIIRKPND